MAAATNEQKIVAIEGKTDLDVVRDMQRSPINLPTAFIPNDMAQVMEFAKMMSTARGAVRGHLLGNPGACLSVALQALRWRMDPFAVASKSFFVNEQLAFEAQLINAVCNVLAPLEGRLQVDWDGAGEKLVCTVRGKLRGDDREKVITQEISSITTRNSPLWKQAPRQQLAYYTTRMWVRLYAPEVLMGVYAPDELQDGGTLVDAGDGTFRPAMANRPRREAAQAADFVEVDAVRLPVVDAQGVAGDDLDADGWEMAFRRIVNEGSLADRAVVIENNDDIAKEWSRTPGGSGCMVAWHEEKGAWDLDVEREQRKAEEERKAEPAKAPAPELNLTGAPRGAVADPHAEVDAWTDDMPILVNRPTGAEQDRWIATATQRLAFAPDAAAVRDWTARHDPKLGRMGAQYRAKINTVIEDAIARLEGAQ
jgi:hypothetical protein